MLRARRLRLRRGPWTREDLRSLLDMHNDVAAVQRLVAEALGRQAAAAERQRQGVARVAGGEAAVGGGGDERVVALARELQAIAGPVDLQVALPLQRRRHRVAVAAGRRLGEAERG